MKKALIGIGLALGVLVLGVLAYAATLPDEWHVKASAEIPASAESLFLKIAKLNEWDQWTAWGREADPGAKREYGGPETGVGSMMSWDGEKIGKGRLEVVKFEPHREIAYHLWFDDSDTPSSGGFRFEPTGATTKVTWYDDGNMGGNLMGRLFIPSLEKMVTADFDKGLANLKKLAEEGKLPTPVKPDLEMGATVTDMAVAAGEVGATAAAQAIQ